MPTRYPGDPSLVLLTIPVNLGEDQEDSLNTITSLADEVRRLWEAGDFLEGELSRAEDSTAASTSGE